MGRIKKYLKFQDLLLESYLVMETDFLDIIGRIARTNSNAFKLWSLSNKNISTNVNYLSMGKSNDDISFINDTQVTRITDAGGDPFLKSRSFSKIGRAVRSILTSNNLHPTDKEIEEFVNAYKVEWDNINSPINCEVVYGDMIAKWYLEWGYEPGRGTLNGSCMRYDKCQEYLKIYTENPEVCKLVILKTPDGKKLLGRALLWSYSETKFYLDRIYTVNDHDEIKIFKWVQNRIGEEDLISHKNSDSINNVKVSLKVAEFEKYPYMDSLPAVNITKKLLQSSVDNIEDLFFHIKETNGSHGIQNWVYSKKQKKYFKPTEAIWVASKEDYVEIKDCIKDTRGNWIYKPESIYSELYKGYCSVSSSTTSKWGIVPTYDLVNVDIDGKGTIERMPSIVMGDKFVGAWSYGNGWRYVVKDQTIKDALGNYFIKSSFPRYSTPEQQWITKMIAVDKISNKGLVKLGDQTRVVDQLKASVGQPAYIESQIWTLDLDGKPSEVPVAIEYIGIGTYTIPIFSKAFNLEVESGGLYGLERNIINNLFDEYVIYHKSISDSIKIIINKLYSKEYLEKLAGIDTLLSNRSMNYRSNKSILPIIHLTTEERIIKYNKLLESAWSSDPIFIKWFINFKEEILKPENKSYLQLMVDLFNRTRPFGVNRRYSPIDFVNWFEENKEKVICQFYIWAITGDRESSAEDTSSVYDIVDTQIWTTTSRWLMENTYGENSGRFGDELYRCMEEPFSRLSRLDDFGLALAKWSKIYAMYVDRNEQTNITYPNAVIAWNMFKSENIKSILKK